MLIPIRTHILILIIMCTHALLLKSYSYIDPFSSSYSYPPVLSFVCATWLFYFMFMFIILFPLIPIAVLVFLLIFIFSCSFDNFASPPRLRRKLGVLHLTVQPVGREMGPIINRLFDMSSAKLIHGAWLLSTAQYWATWVPLLPNIEGLSKICSTRHNIQHRKLSSS